MYKTRDITADFAIYQQRATNFPIVTTLISGPNAGEDQIYTNGGTAQYRGAEFQGTWAFGRHVALNNFSIRRPGADRRLRHLQRQIYPGRQHRHGGGDAPQFTAAGGLVYDNKTVFGSLLQKVTGSQYGAQGQVAWSPTTDAALNHIAPYTTTNAVVGYRYKLPDYFANGLGKSIEIKVGVQNIFDHRSITDISGNPAGLTSVNNTTLAYSFQSGRYIYGAIKYSF